MLPEGWTEKCDTPGSVIAQVHRLLEQFTSDVYVCSNGGSEFSFLELHECHPCCLCVRGSYRDTRVLEKERRRDNEIVRTSEVECECDTF